MQDNNQSLGFPTQDDTIQSRNMAAVALAEAMSRARSQQTGRETAKADLHTGAVIKLEALRKKLAPLYAAIPHDVEMFDLGLISHEKPRLFVDIIAFIEMNREHTGYRFLQETRAGLVVLAETADEKHLVDRVTDYVAQRLIERERALSAEPIVMVATRSAPTEAIVAVATSTARSFAHASSVTLPKSETELLVQDLQAEHSKHHVPVQEPAVTAAEAFRQWSPSAANVNRTEEIYPKPLMVESAHEIDRRLPPMHATQSHSATVHSSAALSEVKPAVAKQGTAAIHTTEEKIADSIAHAVLPLHNTGVSVAAPLTTVLRPLVETVKAATSDPVLQVQKNAAQGISSFAKPVAALAVAAVIPTAVATQKYRTVWPSGWWIWPLLALLLGVGLGALMLYVYAANLVR